MKKKLRLIVILLLISCIGLYFEFRPFTPQLHFNVLRMGEDESLVGINNLGFRPVWTQGYDDFVTAYKVQFFGDPSIEGQVTGTYLDIPDLTRLRTRTLVFVTTPKSVSHIRIGIGVVDWRGREVFLWSEKLSVFRVDLDSSSEEDSSQDKSEE